MTAATDEPFYRQHGDAFVGTASTRGPWHADWQHGGPPSALLGGAIERCDPDAEAFSVARLTIELLKPMLIGVPMELAVAPERLGRRVQRFTATLRQGGHEVARALGLRIRRAELELPSQRILPSTLEPGPVASEPFSFPFFRWPVGYHTAVDVRIAKGQWGRGPAAAWLRARVPLVDDHPSSPLERLLIVADASNGVCPALPVGNFSFLNADLDVHLHRHPSTAWIGLDARAIAETHGIGLNQSALFDEHGELGRCLETLVIERMGGH